ncbi:MAG: V-type ATP synthase subunit D [Nitrososphaeraceae archaeon]|jgi:V/A-type H+/Na+-transporting ATPase subunit D|nr:V-type ATP synthase subunit D [Nitrososphaeraceae archaeon]MBV9667468.1 V-type ATP synthase subunit D [Nitrososphaeraceae archaeon]HET7391915.1 V-type ATP synthase subunit D [Nitrososphaeraceae archaeon]
MSFGTRVSATKIELIKIRRSMQVAKMVHKILDDKREVLLKKIDEMIEEANKARGDIWSPLGEIYTAVYDAYMSLGTATLESVSDSTPSIMEVDVNVRRIVDVKIPTLQVRTKEGGQDLSYGFVETNASVDKAAKLIKNMLPKVCKAAEYENAIFSLAKELERTQKLINALEFVIIPQYEGAVAFIRATLEEREREEFVRLKKVKVVLEKRKVAEQQGSAIEKI